MPQNEKLKFLHNGKMVLDNGKTDLMVVIKKTQTKQLPLNWLVRLISLASIKFVHCIGGKIVYLKISQLNQTWKFHLFVSFDSAALELSNQ